jgi:gamma-glutamylcyclotransferase (GGCT)/AIG2-like uncharacterized protein YtfP
MDLYFAYGSNLLGTRMRERVPGARCAGRASLAGFALIFDKRGRDGSAKANLRPDPDGRVLGVVYELPQGGWEQLDSFEPGYAREVVEVHCAWDGALRRAQTYCSEQRAPELVPAPEYLDLILSGAREQQLPGDWIRAIERAAGQLQDARARR